MGLNGDELHIDNCYAFDKLQLALPFKST